VSLDPEQRAFLLGAKLRALATDLGLSLAGDPVALGGGAAIVDAGTVVALAGEDAPERALGQALLLAARYDAVRLVLFFDDADAASVAARRAAALDPAPEARVVVGAGSQAADAAAALTRDEPPPVPDGFEDLCRGAGVDPIFEHGIWRGEVFGLEVVRATDAGFETGVGRFDREASALLHGDQPTAESLAAAADQVRTQRREGAGAHPLATLARERWLRHDLLADPGRVGLADLAPVDPAVERGGLRAPAPAPAVGTAPDDERVLVVCSVGVDADLVSATADLVLREQPDRVLVVVPPRDVLPPVERAVARLAVPATIIGIEGSWA
jgi:CTP:molybdopterin cytidylyltransferase MocA